MEMNEASVTIDEGSNADAEAVAVLQASGVTARKIDLAYLMELLNFRGMLRKTDGSGGQERWVGTLQNIKSALVAMNQTTLVAAYETWFSHVTNPRQSYWDTTKPDYAAGFWAMKAAFADHDGMPSSEDFAAVAALGGGWLFADLTAEQYAAQNAAASAESERSALRSQWAGILNSGVNAALASGDRDALKAALAAAIEVL